uniref:ATP synthase complex subunit 8 n=1 Tax=Ommexecha virens TaxID=1260741 RepID=M4JCK3_9ORTH|nr:ATP synthase F0 subunit 8 [Ommexecha virens]AGC22389.1 ATP synthase F0 subunit 8 [Ommexecha virens]
MPQMSPLMWFTLFLMFSMLMILFNQMNYFSFKPLLMKSKIQETIKSKDINWKW